MAQRFDFQVRKPFTAEFSCERERANAPCLPVRPMTLRFSEPVPRSVALQVRLKPAAGAALAPLFDRDDTSAEVRQLRFPSPLPENASFTVELPKAVKDAAGRALANAASFPLPVATGDAPPIAKFAAAPFGVIERDAEAALPVTLRHVQGELRPGAALGPDPAGARRHAGADTAAGPCRASPGLGAAAGPVAGAAACHRAERGPALLGA